MVMVVSTKLIEVNRMRGDVYGWALAADEDSQRRRRVEKLRAKYAKRRAKRKAKKEAQRQAQG